MAKFYFNFRQGNAYTVDLEGTEFASVEEAYLEAFRTAQEMWSELLIERQDPLLCAFEIVDQAGNSLFLLPFGEVLDVCRGRGTRPRTLEMVPAIAEALACRRYAQQAIAEVSVSLEDARATLRETMGLLAEVERLVRS